MQYLNKVAKIEIGAHEKNVFDKCFLSAGFCCTLHSSWSYIVGKLLRLNCLGLGKKHTSTTHLGDFPTSGQVSNFQRASAEHIQKISTKISTNPKKGLNNKVFRPNSNKPFERICRDQLTSRIFSVMFSNLPQICGFDKSQTKTLRHPKTF